MCEALYPGLKFGPLLRFILPSFAHAPNDPPRPTPLNYFDDKRKIHLILLAGTVLRIPSASTQEEIYEPFSDEEQPEIVLLGDLRALRPDVLEKRSQERCTGVNLRTRFIKDTYD